LETDSFILKTIYLKLLLAFFKIFFMLTMNLLLPGTFLLCT